MSKLYQIIFDKSSKLHVHCMYCMYLGWSFLWNYVPWCKSNLEITAGCIQARQRFTVVSIFSVKKLIIWIWILSSLSLLVLMPKINHTLNYWFIDREMVRMKKLYLFFVLFVIISRCKGLIHFIYEVCVYPKQIIIIRNIIMYYIVHTISVASSFVSSIFILSWISRMNIVADKYFALI